VVRWHPLSNRGPSGEEPLNVGLFLQLADAW
jgi:hypothetical protein